MRTRSRVRKARQLAIGPAARRSSVRSTQQSMLAALGLALIERGAIPDAPIPLLQSVLIVWPQIVGLVAGAILLFVAAYVVFQRQEVRA